MTASGRIILAVERTKEDATEGFEYSGIDSKGHKVMGMTDHRALSNLILPDPPLTWRIPQDWSLEDAATVPVVYTTVIYGLLMVSVEFTIFYIILVNCHFFNYFCYYFFIILIILKAFNFKTRQFDFDPFCYWWCWNCSFKCHTPSWV